VPKVLWVPSYLVVGFSTMRFVAAPTASRTVLLLLAAAQCFLPSFFVVGPRQMGGGLKHVFFAHIQCHAGAAGAKRQGRSKHVEPTGGRIACAASRGSSAVPTAEQG